jgi:hypothetical protein
VVWRDPDTKSKDWLTFDDEKEAERARKLLDANGQRLTEANKVMASIRNNVPSIADIVERHIAGLSDACHDRDCSGSWGQIRGPMGTGPGL